MADVREMYAQQIAAARLALSQGDRPAAAESFRSAIDVARGEAGLQLELGPALVQLGKLEQELGHPAEAERLLHDALAIGERLFGAEHPSLAVVLNELSRLHIRQSQHARAEAVLDRLLLITQTKGAEHPDVATALAGLAMVKRGLGDDAAAEQRFREALRIREKVLAPNHMAIVVTLEQLAETCASRGNLAEAFALLHRALPTREAALGADHATVRAMRSRIATLAELRRAKAAASAAARQPQAADPVPASRISSKELVFIYEPEPAPRRVSRPQERIATPARSAVVAAAPVVATPMAAPTPAAHPSQQTAAPQPSASASPRVAEPAAPSMQTAAPVRSRLTTPGGSMVIDETSPRRRTAQYLSVGLAAALAIAALTSRSKAGSGGDALTASAEAERRAAIVAEGENGSVTLGARSDSAVLASNTSQSLALLARAEMRAEMRAPEGATPPALPSLPVAARRLAKMSVPVIATNVDSLVRASTKAGRESEQVGMEGGLRASPITDDASGTPPALIGPAPLPYFPDALRSERTEGEVVVRFRVDERGRVDESSMKVLKSDHALFTLAVRSVLSRFRFEPARSPAPESKPRADWVDYRAQFTTKN